jgi:hypothetical protein
MSHYASSVTSDSVGAPHRRRSLRPSLLAPVPPCLRPLSLAVVSPPRGPREGHLSPSHCGCPDVASNGRHDPRQHPIRGSATPPWHVRHLPPSPAPRTLRLCLMPHMPYLPLRHRAIRHFSPRGALRFIFLSDDKPRRSPQRVIFLSPLHCVQTLVIIFVVSTLRKCSYLLSVICLPPPVCLSLDRFV